MTPFCSPCAPAALSFMWVYLKDEGTVNTIADTRAAPSPLTAIDQTSAWMGFIDPLTVAGRYPVSYKVTLPGCFPAFDKQQYGHSPAALIPAVQSK